MKSAINGKVESRGREDEKPEDPWSLCADEVWKFEEEQIKKWKENINSLLLFVSGLA